MCDLIEKLIDSKVKCRIIENDQYIKIFSIGSDAQENYIQIKKINTNNFYQVEEIHRDNIINIFDTSNINQAKAVVSILAIKMYKRCIADEKIEVIKKYVNDKLYDKAEKIITMKFPQVRFSIGKENESGFSLLKDEEERYLLKYKGKIIINNMSATRAYVALYAYCNDLEYIRNWYEHNEGSLTAVIDCELIEELYLEFC